MGRQVLIAVLVLGVCALLMACGPSPEPAEEIDPSYAEAYHSRGLAYYLLEEERKACVDREQACELGLCDM